MPQKRYSNKGKSFESYCAKEICANREKRKKREICANNRTFRAIDTLFGQEKRKLPNIFPLLSERGEKIRQQKFWANNKTLRESVDTDRYRYSDNENLSGVWGIGCRPKFFSPSLFLSSSSSPTFLSCLFCLFRALVTIQEMSRPAKKFFIY